MRRIVYVGAMMATSVLGCARPIRSGDLIDCYRAARCVPIAAVSMSSPSRSWNYKTDTQAGDEILVEGFQGPGGVVTVTFGPNAQREIAARPGDYIYPVDVRLDSAREHLYVKAHGRRAWTIRPTIQRHCSSNTTYDNESKRIVNLSIHVPYRLSLRRRAALRECNSSGKNRR